MSKFVTYPAVTVLDDDQSLLIDSPSAGTNSITAENAGNTLLSKWAGFETFDEAVQNTIENNQEFIDRDTAIREETAELKKKIVTTFPAKDASGAVATFESEFEDAPLKSCKVQINPVQDLHGYDSPWPAGGGKNLADTRNLDVTVAGIHCVSDSDGVISLSGTKDSSTGWKVLTVFTDFAPGNYVFSSNNQHVTCLLNYTQKSSGFTVAEGDIVRIALYNTVAGDTLNDTGIKVQIESGSTATDWTPYENICPITGWESVEIQHGGTNLFDGKIESGDYDVTASAGGTKRSNAARMRCANFIPVKPNTTYYSKSSYSNSVVVFYDEEKWMRSNGGYAVMMNTTFTTPSWCKYITFYFNGTEYNNDISINYPATDHDYHPYTGRSITIDLGQTVYGGYVDVINGELVVDRAMTTNPVWSLRESGTVRPWIRFELNTLFPPAGEERRKAREMFICSKARTAANAGGGVPESAYNYGIWSYGSTTVRIYMADGCTEVDAQAYMEDIQIVYPIPNPIHYPLTPTEIRTLLGVNNIFADCGNTSVEYLMSDVSWYVEKKLRAFQSILAGVEDSSTASKNYSANTYLVFNDDIYRVTKAITAGETIEEGVNVTKTTVAEQLLALAQV